jgi:hypothetical protein
VPEAATWHPRTCSSIAERTRLSFQEVGESAVTSPNQQGVEGTDCQEVWIVTEELVILFKSPPYIMGMVLSSLVRRHISPFVR